MKVCDRGHAAAHLAIRPLEHLLVRHGARATAGATAGRVRAHVGEEGQHVRAHELPDKRERQLLVAVDNILAADAHEREVERILAKVDDVAAVLIALEDHLHILVDARPRDDAWADVIHGTQQHQPVAHVLEEIIAVDALEAKRIDPHAERALLPSVALVVISRKLGHQLGDLFLLGRLEGGARVEQRRDECEVELVVATHDVRRLHRELCAEPRPLRRDVRRALGQVSLREDGGVAALLGIDLLQEVGVELRVLQVRAKVSHALRAPRLLQMVVEPAHEELLGRELEQ
mmetsp:Transcript_50019/g.130284  ORF Transcript_50019/g.130284 Transcript_50019/m.130284 type:complete len:289 (+) Transcript_50019:741-1607(+)